MQVEPTPCGSVKHVVDQAPPATFFSHMSLVWVSVMVRPLIIRETVTWFPPLRPHYKKAVTEVTACPPTLTRKGARLLNREVVGHVH